MTRQHGQGMIDALIHGNAHPAELGPEAVEARGREVLEGVHAPHRARLTRHHQVVPLAGQDVQVAIDQGVAHEPPAAHGQPHGGHAHQVAQALQQRATVLRDGAAAAGQPPAAQLRPGVEPGADVHGDLGEQPQPVEQAGQQDVAPRRQAVLQAQERKQQDDGQQQLGEGVVVDGGAHGGVHGDDGQEGRARPARSGDWWGRGCGRCHRRPAAPERP